MLDEVLKRFCKISKEDENNNENENRKKFMAESKQVEKKLLV